MKKILGVIFWVITLQLSAQCPTLPVANMQFCDIDQPQVRDLVAVDNGQGFAWFSSPTSTVPFDPNTFLINGQELYLDNASGNCGNRQLATITVLGAPSGINFQGLCVNDGGDATIADLLAIGNDIRWYDSAFGGNELPLSTPLVNGEVYYADQANPATGCRTSRLFVEADVVVVNVPTGAARQSFCEDPNNPPVVGDLVTNSNNRWYRTVTSAVPIDPSTPLIDGQDYYATSIDLPCESINRLRVDVTLIPANNAGIDTTVNLCTADFPAQGRIALLPYLDGSPRPSGRWTGSTSIVGSVGNVDPDDLVPSGSPYNYTYTFRGNGSCPPASATLTVIVTDPLYAGTDGSLDICETDGVFNLFNQLSDNPDPGGVWTPALVSGTGIFDPLVDLPGIYTYSFAPVAPCNQASSATVNVSVQEEANAGVGFTLDLCDNEAPLDLFSLLTGNPDTGGVWIPSLNSGTGLFDPSIDLAGSYRYVVSSTSPCNQDDESTVIINVDNALNAGDDASITVCEDQSSFDLFTLLGPDADTGGTWSPSLSSGTGVFDPSIDSSGIYTYEINSSGACNLSDISLVNVSVSPVPNDGNDANIDICENGSSTDLLALLGPDAQSGGIWTPSLSSGSGIFNPSVDQAGSYTYTVSATAPCTGTDSSTVVVNFVAPPNAGNDAFIDLCSSDAAIDLFTLLGGNPDPNGTWTPALNSGSGIFDPSIDTAGVYEYRVQDNTVCLDTAAANVTVNIQEEPNSGISTSITICAFDGPTNLLLSLGGSPDRGGTWTPGLSNGNNIFDPDVDTAGIYTYTVAPTAPCLTPSSSTVAVTVEPLPDPGSNAVLTICRDDAPVNLFNVLGGNPDAGGFWNPALSSGTGVFDPAIDSSGTYFYTILSPAPCNIAATAFVTVNVFHCSRLETMYLH